ncbi:MAG: class I SAM-dependent methyltransferase [Dehalococcoidia bacterium]
MNKANDAPMPTRSPWEDEARNWIKWARTPGHDVFLYYAPSFFDEIVPDTGGLTLEIGCGEGRVARQLASRAHNVVALDSSLTLVRHAREADALSAYLVADATALPFADATFQTVVAYNSLQTMGIMADMAKTVQEAGRVVKPSGHFCLCVAHPMTDVGRVKEPSADGDLVISGSYFEQQCVNDTVTKDGLTMTFHGWTYTLEDYVRALEEAGFLIERVREPIPSSEQVTQRPSLEGWRRVPLFLFIRAVKRAR